MTEIMPPQVRVQGEAALKLLDRVMHGAKIHNGEFAEVFGHLVAMRDDIIKANRARECGDPLLRRTNAIISSFFGIEYPVDGLHWRRVRETREALRDLMRREGPRLSGRENAQRCEQ